MAGLVIANDRVIAATVSDDSQHVAVVRFSSVTEIPRAVREALRSIPGGRRSPVTMIMPCERSKVYERKFHASLDAGKRIRQVQSNDIAPQDFDVNMISSVAVTMRPITKTESLVGLAPRELLQQYLLIAKEARIRLHAVEWEAFAWQRLLYSQRAGTPITIPSDAAEYDHRSFLVSQNGTTTIEREAPAATDGPLADAIVVGTPQNLSVIVFDEPAPHTKTFSMINDGWAGAISDFLSEIVVKTSARIDPQTIAVLGDFSETTRSELQFQISRARVCRIETLPSLSDDPLALLALAAADGEPRFDFRGSLRSERFSVIFERERALIVALASSLALAAVLDSGYLWYTKGRIAQLAAVINEKTAAYDTLATQRKADELHLGGSYGDIAPYLSTIVDARASGAEFAIAMQDIGNDVGDKTWLTAYTQHLDSSAAFTIDTRDYTQGVAFQLALNKLGQVFPAAALATVDDDTVQFSVIDQPQALNVKTGGQP
jgi:hypothetical protein